MIELQIIQCNMHGSGDLHRFIELEFHTVAAASVQKEQIEFGTAVGRPEEALGRTEDLQKLIQGESFSRGTHTWMPPKILHVKKAEQCIEESGVPKINLMRFDRLQTTGPARSCRIDGGQGWP